MHARIFIVEDHPLVRTMLHELIDATSGLDVIGVAASGEEALTSIPTIRLDLLLIDVSLPGMNGFDLLAAVVARWPKVLCLMLSGHQESRYAKRALDTGARGYVVKGNPREITIAIRNVLAGEIYLSATLEDG